MIRYKRMLGFHLFVGLSYSRNLRYNVGTREVIHDNRLATRYIPHTTYKMRSFTLITTALLLANISSINGLSSAPTLIPGEVNSQLAYAKSKFPIASDDLINRAKEVLSSKIEIGTKDNGECLADDFEFVAAVVGPLPKKEYLDALGSFKLVSRELCLLFCY